MCGRLRKARTVTAATGCWDRGEGPMPRQSLQQEVVRVALITSVQNREGTSQPVGSLRQP